MSIQTGVVVSWIKDIQKTYPDQMTYVAVDEGGLSLVGMTITEEGETEYTGHYLEIGGIPEDD